MFESLMKMILPRPDGVSTDHLYPRIRQSQWWVVLQSNNYISIHRHSQHSPLYQWYIWCQEVGDHFSVFLLRYCSEIHRFLSADLQQCYKSLLLKNYLAVGDFSGIGHWFSSLDWWKAYLQLWMNLTTSIRRKFNLLLNTLPLLDSWIPCMCLLDL